MDDDVPGTQLARLCGLDDHTRRRLYDHVAAHAEPVSRDTISAALDIDRSLAAYHLDKLVDRPADRIVRAAGRSRHATARGGNIKLRRGATMDVGDQLPWLHDATDDNGRRLNWRDTRRNRIVFFAHPGACAACASYARDLLDIGDGLDLWDADIWLVGVIDDGTAPSATNAVRITGDADRRLRRRCGLAPEDVRVIVADRWGQIWQTAVADDRHVLVYPADVLETTKFIAIQCPECETLDQPTGDWSNVH